MDTVDEVFDEFKGPTAFANAIGIKVSAASEMRRRKSIPACYWLELVAVAPSCGVHGLTYEKLAQIHARSVTPADSDRVRAS